MEGNHCAVCGIKAPLRCSGCLSVYYCSKDHQQVHWKLHKPSCCPFKVEWDTQIGHHLVASRDIKPGEMILQEEPIILCPEDNGSSLCAGCCSEIDVKKNSKKNQCPRCDMLMCGRPKCWEEGSLHALAECQIRVAAKSHPVPSNYFRVYTSATFNRCTMVLRCLALKKINPAKCDKLTRDLKYCGSAEYKSKRLEDLNLSKTIQLVRDFVPNEDVSDEWITKMCTAFALNGLGLSVLPGVRAMGMRGIYPMGSLIDHSCLANATRTFTIKTGKLLVRAALPIAKGTRICVNYSRPMFGTVRRRNLIEDSGFDTCRCQRCSDPTEMGTYTSAIFCHSCPYQKGILLPINPLNKDSDWSCNTCFKKRAAALITQQLERAQKDCKGLDGLSVGALEALLVKYEKILHPHHYFMIEVKWNLIHQYGSFEDPKVYKSPMSKFKKKEVYTRELIEIMDVVCPGMQRMRGILMYHLFTVLLVQCQSDTGGGGFVTHAREMEKLLRDSYAILDWGPEETPETSNAMSAADLLKTVQPMFLAMDLFNKN